MPNTSARFAAIISSSFLLSLSAAAQDAKPAPEPLKAEAVEKAALDTIPAAYAAPAPAEPLPEDVGQTEASLAPENQPPDPAIVKLQVLLDWAGVSPGVVDGLDGANLRSALLAFETLNGLNADGVLDPAVLGKLDAAQPVMTTYTITQDDEAAIVPALPSDYAELAKRDHLGFTSVPESLAERFHMSIGLLEALNPGARFQAGDTVTVSDPGPERTGKAAKLVADVSAGQLRAYDESGLLLSAYPATIGSSDNPSPSGTHAVEAVAANPTYTYNPQINFQQGGNTEVLVLPPGPNGPVGSIWIGLSKPTYGIHGTPEPALIGKVGSHGCVRLTNWDAAELAHMVAPGVQVEFLDKAPPGAGQPSIR